MLALRGKTKPLTMETNSLLVDVKATSVVLTEKWRSAMTVARELLSSTMKKAIDCSLILLLQLMK